jgi:hypothetical protein
MKNRNQDHSNHWKTPIYISRWVKENYGKCFDPCPYMANFDGLKIMWKKLNYVNPGYDLSTKTAFVKRAVHMQTEYNLTTLVLIPATLETKLFTYYVYPFASKIYVPRFRPQFAGFNTKGKYVTDQTGQNTIVLIEFNGNDWDISKMPELIRWDLKK